MGSRLSVPRGVAGTTEASHIKRSPYPRGSLPFNSRQLVAPLAAFTMAGILFVYARTSIRVAKDNAQRHRNIDSGGEGLDLLSESRRRHGLGKKIDNGNSIGELVSGAKNQFLGANVAKEPSLDEPKAPDKLKEALRQQQNGA